MLNSVSAYNALNGASKSRQDLTVLIAHLEQDEQTHLANKLTLLLAEYPDTEQFNINLDVPGDEIPQAALLRGLEYVEDPDDEGAGLNKAVSPNEIYQYITELMINTIKEVGHLPWQKGWEDSGLAVGKEAQNFESKKGYRGINFFLLNFKINPKGYLEPVIWENPYFLTFNQIEKLGGKLRKGSKGKRVIYFTKLYSHKIDNDLKISTYNRAKFKAWVTKHKAKIKQVKALGVDSFVNRSYYPILKYYNVFNGGDVEGVDFGTMPTNDNNNKSESDRLDICEAIVQRMPKAPKLIFGGNQPFYQPSADTVAMTPLKQFKQPQEYYSTFFHELVHSTGHESRLNRNLGGTKKSKEYAFEELIAEMGAVFLCAESGILFKTIHNAAKYLRGWNSRLVKQMEDDNRFFFKAASASQAASDFILDRNKEGIPAYTKGLKKTKKGPEKDQKKQEAQQMALWGAAPPPDFHYTIVEDKRVPEPISEPLPEQKTPAVVEEAPEPKSTAEQEAAPTTPPTVATTTQPEPVKPQLAAPVVEKKEVKKGKRPKGVITGEELMSMHFESLELTGEWAQFMKHPAKNMKIAIWGKPKNGKTSGALQLGNYLTKHGNVLYNFADQGINKSTQDLWRTMGINDNHRMDLTKGRSLKQLEEICKDGYYSFVFIDMINTYIDRTKIKPHEFEDRFIKAFPDISFILVFEVTKSGNFKGDQQWTHLPDALVTVEDYVMKASGRYGIGHKVVWKEGLKKQNPKAYLEYFPETEEESSQEEELPIPPDDYELSYTVVD